MPIDSANDAGLAVLREGQYGLKIRGSAVCFDEPQAQARWAQALTQTLHEQMARTFVLSRAECETKLELLPWVLSGHA